MRCTGAAAGIEAQADLYKTLYVWVYVCPHTESGR